ncbi:hypothetical protein CW304_08805 [Bacillus sp. UFRGS-B20]|nr:hypothetical protein CW304_08805 [Bacillus sp. UFRGS-B20]
MGGKHQDISFYPQSTTTLTEEEKERFIVEDGFMQDVETRTYSRWGTLFVYCIDKLAKELLPGFIGLQ